MYGPHEDGRPREGARALVLSFFVLIVLVGAGAFLASRWFGGGDRRPDPRPVTPRGDLADFEKTIVGVFERAAPSVVSITNIVYVRQRNVFGGSRTAEVERNSGSGFIWDEQGRIVTNWHVVENGSRFSVHFPKDGETYEAQLVGGAPNYDLAVLVVDAPKRVLRPLDVGTSEDLRVGQTVIAIGQPFGLDHSLSTGVVSALGREISAQTGRADRVIRNVIQTDAAINPGNSGGPLLDSAGRLIGVNTQIYSEVRQNSGISFAIPVDTVNWVVPEIIAKGRVVKPTLGVRLAGPEDRVTWGQPRGAYVLEAIPDGPAAKAGLRGAQIQDDTVVVEGDIIVQVGKDRIRSPTELIMALERFEEGDEVPLRFLRNGEVKEATAVLSAPTSR